MANNGTKRLGFSAHSCVFGDNLRRRYGFALDRNPFNSVALSVGVSRDDPLYEVKAEFAALAGRTAEATAFPLFLDRFPDELFQVPHLRRRRAARVRPPPLFLPTARSFCAWRARPNATSRPRPR